MGEVALGQVFIQASRLLDVRNFPSVLHTHFYLKATLIRRSSTAWESVGYLEALGQKTSTFILSFSHFTGASPHSPLLNYPASILPLRGQLGNARETSEQHISALMLPLRNNWSVPFSPPSPSISLSHCLGSDVYEINSTFCIFMPVFPGHKHNGLL
jgi:hypothetical protein